MSMKDRRERRGGGVILYIKDTIQAYEIALKSEAVCEEEIWLNHRYKDVTRFAISN